MGNAEAVAATTGGRGGVATSPLQQRVVAVVHRVTRIPLDQITLDADLRADFGVDSILALQIAALIEKEFDVHIPDEDLGSYATVREIVCAVEALQGDP